MQLLEIPHAEYLSVKALSSTGLRTYQQSPEIYRRLYVEGVVQTGVEKQFQIGTALHTAVLDGMAAFERDYACAPAGDKRLKHVKEEWDAFDPGGRIVLEAADYGQILAMRGRVTENAIASSLLRGGLVERSLFWSWGGVACKSRPDILYALEPVLVDLKTTSASSADMFSRKVFDFGYHQQLAFYCRSLFPYYRLSSVGKFTCYIVAVEKSEPHIVRTYRLPAEALRYADRLNAQAIRRLERSMKTGDYRDPSSGCIIDINIPVYLKRQMEDDSV